MGALLEVAPWSFFLSALIFGFVEEKKNPTSLFVVEIQ
jgi:hypothetical protein